ncbi:MAG: hypothetical protein JXJ17_01215 [Anaerolineae bacterium]|nr:hypothetical protein [Anaerolineae bacterium]
MTVTNKLKKAIEDKALSNNLRGQLAVALRMIPERISKVLACDYSEHVLWIVDSVRPNIEYPLSTNQLRNYINGSGTIQEVIELRSQALQLRHKLTKNDATGYIALKALWTLVLAIRVCAQRELEHLAVVVKENRQTTTMDVAHQASLAVARYTAGVNWNSPNAKQKELARKKVPRLLYLKHNGK